MIMAILATWFLVGVLVSLVGMGLTLTRFDNFGDDHIVPAGLMIMGSSVIVGIAVGIVALWVEKPWLS